jgi:hypothetical protein
LKEESMLRSAVLVAASAALLATPVVATARATATTYNRAASVRAARTWAFEARALAPQVSEQPALNPQGPAIIASQPVPDTPANRARYGEPMSRAGRLTAPIGD